MSKSKDKALKGLGWNNKDKIVITKPQKEGKIKGNKK